MPSLYELLGLSRNATSAEIAAAHRRAAKAHHPDRGGDRARFEAIQRAAVVLRDPARRQRYDLTGDADDAPNNELSELTRVLIGVFDRVVGEAGGAERDVVGRMRQLLEQQARVIDSAIKALDQQAQQLDRWRERLVFRGDGPDMIARTLTQRREQLAGKAKAQAAEAAAIARAIAELQHYDWAWDRPPPAGVWTDRSLSTPPWEDLTSAEL